MPQLTHCRVCQGQTFTSIVNFGGMAQCGRFPNIGEDAPSLPLHLVQCVSCGLVQLGDTYDPTDLYGSHYGYRTALNRSMVDHVERIVKEEVPRWVGPLAPRSSVLDIGSNDGTLLGFYPQDVHRIGIDPAMSTMSPYYSTGIDRVEGFFGQEALGGPFKVITSIAVFYDVDDPVEFAREVRDRLADDGVWILEVAYWPALAKQGVYDVVCHEHQAYYGLNDLHRILTQAGLFILDGSFNPVNGGSVRVVAGKQKPAGPARWLENLPDLEVFKKQVAAHGPQLRNLLDDYARRGKRVHGYGASTKGNTVLQWAGITPELLPCILDVNPSKRGCWTPGTHIPIVMEDETPDAYLVLPWHFRPSIIKREQDFLRKGGELIFPLPTLEVVTW